MPKTSVVADSLPPPAAAALRALGAHLAIARKRRRESQRAWAARIGISVPTLIRMEGGDPGVSMAVYATALWLMGRAQALAELADPATDLAALERDVRAAQTRAVRRPASIARRLQAAPGSATPSAPAEPAKPTKVMKATEPTGPTKTTKPTKPTKPTEPTKAPARSGRKALR